MVILAIFVAVIFGLLIRSIVVYFVCNCLLLGLLPIAITFPQSVGLVLIAEVLFSQFGRLTWKK